MKPLLTASQGRLVRAIVLFLSNGGGRPCDCDGIFVESIDSCEWSSLTFAGERHRLVLRLPADAAPDFDPEAMTIDLPDAVVAVEGATWAAAGSDRRLALDLLTIAANDAHA